jgi:hypothetical protein
LPRLASNSHLRLVGSHGRLSTEMEELWLRSEWHSCCGVGSKGNMEVSRRTRVGCTVVVQISVDGG